MTTQIDVTKGNQPNIVHDKVTRISLAKTVTIVSFANIKSESLPRTTQIIVAWQFP